ncbi:NAD-dependent succinate-semialdehyde dehydrogenase [Hymenobacter sp. RP-2-7]|uniref:NAD-dependent succinate-semialdehyde dehydrogenase n=1 Tax=Hymenobacter polaris TaxID=2682546 RepID=A0A7Y0ACG1_9BACT|nr:NAD-dependent succinate-semialdehyde dehydrogenase [Hymenobacter polaris]NML64804.1 NAD-dependent succinate-semialdehyde dehydrogenase [Hymenobacter polaris]
MVYESINPYTGRRLRRFATLGPAQLERRLARAHRAAAQWRATSFAERAAVLHRTAELLRARQDELARLMALEMGKPLRDGRAEAQKCASCCDYYAAHAEGFLADEEVTTDGTRSYLSYAPLGVVLAIMPWNFPLWQVVRFAAPALMAGNVGLLKHAPNVPQCALALEKLLHDAGVPPTAFQNLFITNEQVAGLLADDRVRAATLTGSERAGAAVAAAAGQHIKKTVLELGGSDPFIVLADADLALAARTAAQARLINAGQSCIAAKRFIVEKPVVREFTRLLVSHLRQLRYGDPLADTTDYGPLARPDLANQLATQVADSVALGAKVELAGGQPHPGSTRFDPLVLSHVKPGQRAYAEELFGPVALVLTARDAADAVRLANDSRFGLGAAIWTQDVAQAERLARQLENGAVFINGLVKSMNELPFGGVKKSGYGRELSYQGIREFTNHKAVWIK